MTPLRPVWSIVVGNLVLLMAILVFASGFFPHKPFMTGRAQFTPTEQLQRPVPPFDRIIFMVVDALRSDFVYTASSGFTFVQQLIRQGYAVPFTAHASSPTITMPKVKAITTGSVPSFLDVILNFAESDTTATLAHMDTWLNQLRHMPNGKIVMYGDDTWLKLFPGFFDRADGTSSFFVSDFTEVDNNVTRHLHKELNQTDWNGWFMHYLGLDHIGHKSGPKSPHMYPKQREMDNIVREIYQSMTSRQKLASTLLILCGDHGMNDVGNHGGATAGETSPALVFISPNLNRLNFNLTSPLPAVQTFQYYSVVEQSDIVPTVAALMGFPVPLNNLGVFISEFLQLWPEEKDQLHLLKQNVRQMHQILVETLGEDPFTQSKMASLDCRAVQSDEQKLQCGWLAQSDDFSTHLQVQGERSEFLYEYLRTAQEILSTTASNYDMSKLRFGIMVAGLAFVWIIAALIAQCTSAADRRGLLTISVMTSAYGAMVFASSFVEEEQQFWYWVTSLMICYIFLLRYCKESVSVRSVLCYFWSLLVTRVVRRWNQTGQKFAGDPDIASTFLRGQKHLLWLLISCSYIYCGVRLGRRKWPFAPRALPACTATAIVVSAMIFKINFTIADAPELITGLETYLGKLAGSLSLVTQARATFTLLSISLLYLIGALAYDMAGRKEDPRFTAGAIGAIKDLLYILLLMQTRVNSIPLFLLFHLLANNIQDWHSIMSIQISPIELAASSLILQHLSFFALGGTNSISSVDLSNAYNGISGYNVLAVGTLTFVSNWAGPVWWIGLSTSMLQGCHGGKGGLEKYALALTFFVSGTVIATMVACTVLRTHLFIWTVFSPKYLYSMVWTIGQHLCVNLGLTSVLYWLHRPM